MGLNNSRFRVDSRLARPLSQEYPSEEKALKEPVDNTWDTDLENVPISLTAPMTSPQDGTDRGLLRCDFFFAVLKQVQYVHA